METQLKQIITKKHLGQFFSGEKVANLLHTLSGAAAAKSVIDPMCGVGDMLNGFASINFVKPILTGIEVDESIYKVAVSKFQKRSDINLINANVFDSNLLEKLPKDGYDLVITNPPYVRRETAFGEHMTLALAEIRHNLKIFLASLTTVTEYEKKIFSYLITHFSGSSDLAVPSWFLCSLLVKNNGKLAMVLPESWLSRDYALIIKYLLLRFYKLEYIVEDGNSTWFKPAQVKTILLVATRVHANNSILNWNKEKFAFTTLYSSAISENSLVGNIHRQQGQKPENSFLSEINLGKSQPDLFDTKHIFLKDFAENLASQVKDKKWYQYLEPLSERTCNGSIRLKSSSMLGAWTHTSNIEFATLKTLGVSVGQGLRTGANDFFYLSLEKSSSEIISVSPNNMFGFSSFKIDKKFAREVIRKQSDLNSNFSTTDVKSKGIVLALQNYALPEDILSAVNDNIAFEKKYGQIPDDLCNYIRVASQTKNGGKPSDKLIPELSAVKPNIKEWRKSQPYEIPRFWYMLPEFSRRHCPDLFIPRVNGDTIRTRINKDSKYLIDANFTSLWINDPKLDYDEFSLLALLNSSYAIVAMEEYGTVLGGGALKLEATQLKSVPFPIFDLRTIRQLHSLGKELSEIKENSSNIISRIDDIIITSMGFKKSNQDKLIELFSIKQLLLKKRRTNL